MTRKLEYRNSVLKAYPEVYTPAALGALEVLVPLNRDLELIARRIARGVKPPWYIDLLNLSLTNYDLATAKSRIRSYIEAFERDGTRMTENLDFGGLKQGALS
jgi:hypothetical protein